MAIIKAFYGFRPPKELAKEVAAPPYDVLNSDEARVMAKDNEKSFLHVNKPEIDLDPSISLYDEIVYQTAKNNLQSFIDKNWLVKESKPCFYAYRQIMDGHAQVGLMACAAVDDYDNDRIKKHEKTRKEKEDDRAKHVEVTSCNAGPVFLTYKADKTVDKLMEEIVKRDAEYDFVADDGIQHTMWLIDNDEEIQALTTAFGNIDPTYVADGHHRAKSGSRVRDVMKGRNPNHTGNEEYNYFLTVYFPHDQLKILDYNRVVKDLNGLSKQDFLNTVKEHFEVENTETAKPQSVHDFGMYLGGKWYKLTAKKGSFAPKDPVGCLDVSILQQNLLSPVLGVKDPRTDKRIDFIGGIRGMKELEKRVNSGDWQIAFAMYPTTMEQLMDIADAGEIMPPKSTWFEPKLRSGLVVHLLD